MTAFRPCDYARECIIVRHCIVADAFWFDQRDCVSVWHHREMMWCNNKISTIQRRGVSLSSIWGRRSDLHSPLMTCLCLGWTSPCSSPSMHNTNFRDDYWTDPSNLLVCRHSLFLSIHWSIYETIAVSSEVSQSETVDTCAVLKCLVSSSLV